MIELVIGAGYLLVILTVGYVFKHLIDKQSKKLEERIHNTNQQIKESNACFDGLKAVLKNQMLDLTLRCETRGFTTAQECEYFQSILDCYVQLKGNSIVPRLEKRFFALPSSEEIRRVRPDLFKIALEKENNWIYDADAEYAASNAKCCKVQKTEEEKRKSDKIDD